MTPEERIQKLNEMLGKAKKAMDDAINKGLDSVDNAGRKFEDFMNPQDNTPAPPANDIVETPPKPPKKTRRVHRF